MAKVDGKDEKVVVQDTDVESRYQPARWQSNITLVSCVSRGLRESRMIADRIVHCQLQRWVSELPGQSHECHLQASAGQ